MHHLPPLPPAIKILKPEDSDRLDSMYGDLPKSLDDCVTCAGRKKFNWWDNHGSSTAKVVEYECPCVDQFILFKYFLNAGIGKLYQRMSLGDCTNVPPEALEAIVDYTVNQNYYVPQGRGLLFHGDHGTGKTLAIALLFKQLLAEGVDGYFTTFNGLLDNFASGWRNDDNRVWFERRVRNTPLLVVDDIGRENKNLNNMASNALDTIFRSRVQNALPTIITTNLSPTDFERTYSSGVMGLVVETSLSYSFTGESWRKNQEKRTKEEATLRLTRPIVIT